MPEKPMTAAEIVEKRLAIRDKAADELASNELPNFGGFARVNDHGSLMLNENMMPPSTVRDFAFWLTALYPPEQKP